MPSFTRRTPSTTQAPPGSRPSPSTPNQYLLPTGIPSLDDLLAGGLPLSQISLMFAPDTHSAWSRLISRYWIAQGLLLGQKSLIISDDLSGRDLVKGCMWVVERGSGSGGVGMGMEGGSESDGEGVGDGNEGVGKTKIAWRYDKMRKFQTTITSQSQSASQSQTGGKELDLTTTIPKELLDHLEKSGIQAYITLEPPCSGSSAPSAWSIMSNVLGRLQGVLDGHDDKAALRITIHELGSIDWGEPTQTEIHRFLHCLRTMIRTKSTSILITFPPTFTQTPYLSHLSDTSLTLQGFASHPTLPILYPSLHGLLTPHTLPTSHNILPPSFRYSTLLGLSSGAGENNLGFKAKRRRWGVETVHLGIEGGVGERRSEPSPGMELIGGAQTGETVNKRVEGLEGGKKGGAGEVQEGSEGVDRPKGPKEGKVKKVRARVRFGGEEELGGEVETQQPEVQVNEDDGHDHANHEHGHAHPHAHGPPRPELRHDRPDLYEF